MSIVVALALGVLSLVFVFYPLFRRASGEDLVATLPADGKVEPTERERNARTALQEVELDYQLGNIAEEDYRTLRERYMRRALVALKSRYEHEQAIDEEIEEQLRQMKERHEKTDLQSDV